MFQLNTVNQLCRFASSKGLVLAHCERINPISKRLYLQPVICQRGSLPLTAVMSFELSPSRFEKQEWLIEHLWHAAGRPLIGPSLRRLIQGFEIPF